MLTRTLTHGTMSQVDRLFTNQYHRAHRLKRTNQLPGIWLCDGNLSSITSAKLLISKCPSFTNMPHSCNLFPESDLQSEKPLNLQDALLCNHQNLPTPNWCCNHCMSVRGATRILDQMLNSVEPCTESSASATLYRYTKPDVGGDLSLIWPAGPCPSKKACLILQGKVLA